jgi:ABC-2 type transport system permease protein
MTTLFSSELYKLCRSKASAFGVFGAMAMAATIVLAIRKTSSGGSDYFGQYGVTVIDGVSSVLILWLAVFTAFFVAAEFQYGTIRNSLSLGKPRAGLFLTKVVSAALILAAAFLAVAAVATAGNSLFFGFGNMPPHEFASYFAWNYAMRLLYHLPYVAVFCMIAVTGRSPALTVALGVGYHVANMGFLQLFGGSETLNFAMRLIPDYYILSFHKMSGDPAFAVNSILVSAAYIAIACAVGCFVFSKKDVK